MQSLNGQLIFSATDLSNFLECPHLTFLTRRVPVTSNPVLAAEGVWH